MSSAAPVKRACDSCHRRKVKCIGEDSKQCKNCLTAGLTCTYNAIPQKKGPKGSRAKVLSELRETQRQSHGPTGLEGGFDNTQMSPILTRTAGLLQHDLIKACVDFYLANLYPSQPILHPEKFNELVMTMDHSVEAYSLMAAFCASMLIQTNLSLPRGLLSPSEHSAASNLQVGAAILDESIRVRRSYNHTESPSTQSVMTSFYLFKRYHSLDRENAAWYYLREATTQAIALGMHDEATYKEVDVVEMAKKRRLYWLLYLNERAYALSKHRSLTLQPTIELPIVGEDPSEQITISAFIHLIKLYRPFDATFMALWNKMTPTCPPQWLAQLQKQLNDALPDFLESTEAQVVDLRINQLWLQTMVWQLAISHGFISSATGDSAMSFKFPIDISRDLSVMSQQFSQHAMEVHGIGLVEKLFDIACTLADVIACVPMDHPTFDPGPREYLNQVSSLVSSLGGGQNRYVPALRAKIGETLPDMTVAMSRPMPTTTSPAAAELYRHNSHSAPPITENNYDHQPTVQSQQMNAGLHFPNQHGANSIVNQGQVLHGYPPAGVNFSNERIKVEQPDLHATGIYSSNGQGRGAYRT